MDTLSFLQLIVPEYGVKFVTEWVPKATHPRGGVMLHHPVSDFDDMVDKINECNARDRNTYYAMASYKEVQYKTIERNGREFTFPVGRKQDNVAQVKALWVDFDVGKKDAFSYDTRQDALDSLKRYIELTELPVPLLVFSGNGFHAYWVFEEAVNAEEWKLIARLQRAAMRFCNVKFDTSRDVDSASILRPLGTTNFNSPGNRTVELRKTKAEHRPMPVAFYKRLFQKIVMAHDLHVESDRPKSNLAPEEREYPPSSLDKVAQHCQQIRFFKAGEPLPEPLWYAMLGVAKHCVDGETFAHQWSALDERYDAEICQQKMDQWAYGPTTCSKFKSLCGDRCEGCVHDVMSPIQLGYSEETVAPEPVLEVETEGATTAQVGEILGWPDRYVFRNNILHISSTDEDGVVEFVPVAFPKFYVEYTTPNAEDGTEILHIVMERPMDGVHRFDMPRKALSDAKKSTKPFLMSYGITVLNEGAAMNFLLQHANNLSRLQQQVKSFNQFGWTPERTGFLLGDQLITEDDVRTVRLSDKHLKNKDMHRAYEVRGTAEQWVEGVDFLYNRAGFEPYQYAVCATFGGLIASFIDDDGWRGIPLALTSDQSGRGKSTICKIALNGISRANLTTLGDVTPKAALLRASNMNHVPVLFDEVTKTLGKPEDLMDFLYAMSNGRGRVRLNQDGSENVGPPGWTLMALLTGNKNLMFQLTENKTNPEAAQMRVLEISLDEYYSGKTKLEQIYGDEFEQCLEVSNRLVNEVSCVLTLPYVRAVMKNRGKITEMLRREFHTIMSSLGNGATRERFYAYHIACSIVGAKLAAKLGFLKFDLAALRKWILRHVKHLRGVAEEYNLTVEDKFGLMLADLHGTILVTQGYESLDSRRREVEFPLVPMRGPIAARLVLGNEKERPKLYVTHHAIDEWCRKHGVNAAQFKRDLSSAGISHPLPMTDDRVYLARGVPTVPSGRSRVMELNVEFAQGYIAEFVEPVSEVAKTALAKAASK